MEISPQTQSVNIFGMLKEHVTFRPITFAPFTIDSNQLSNLHKRPVISFFFSFSRFS